MTFEEIMGSSLETKILDLIVPLSNDDEFTVENLAHAPISATPVRIKKILDANVTRKFLLKFEGSPDGSGGSTYKKNPGSKHAWALNNLLHSIYADKIRAESMKKLGIREKAK